MWLDSKAVNCPQKWGNFALRELHTIGYTVNLRLRSPKFVTGTAADGCPRNHEHPPREYTGAVLRLQRSDDVDRRLEMV